MMGRIGKNWDVMGSMTGKDSEIAVEPGSIFRGHFRHTLDKVGRCSLPASFRSVLQTEGVESVVLTNYVADGARCLDGYSVLAWSALEAKLSERSRFDPQLRQFENFYLARAAECSVDGHGRINIPSYLRAYAGLEKNVIFTATLRGFRVWDVRVWDVIFSDAEGALMADPGLFSKLDL